MAYTTTKKFTDVLKRHTGGFHPVVPHTGDERFLLLDFTESNRALTPPMLMDTAAFAAYVVNV